MEYVESSRNPSYVQTSGVPTNRDEARNVFQDYLCADRGQSSERREQQKAQMKSQMGMVYNYGQQQAPHNFVSETMHRILEDTGNFRQ